MADWIQLFVSYWWIIAIVIATFFVVTNVHSFFRFFTTLVSLVAIFYVATIIFIPPSDNLPTNEISKVLGVNTSVEESTSSSEAAENPENSVCFKQLDSPRAIGNCVGEWTRNIKMPDFGGLVVINYDETQPVTE